MSIVFSPIGFVSTQATALPRHYSVSDVTGTLVLEERFTPALADIVAGQKIVVLFYFHKSPPFTDDLLCQTPPHRNREMGVFSICSPVRPNPIGLSVLDVVAVEKNIVHVKGLDMYDGTPILDIKPHFG